MFDNMLIAEIGSVHDGSFGNACQLIKLAAECGADAVKFQTHIASAESLNDAPSPSYFSGESRIDYFNRISFSKSQWMELSQVASDNNVVFLSSPFSIEAVELLEDIGMEMYKIPSGEITNIPMLKVIADLNKPIILSSGMSNWDELDRAVEVCSKSNDLAVMQCSSIYPTPAIDVGLNILGEIQNRYKVITGFSDHTLGLSAPIAAVALGAKIVEKHFTFSKSMYGSDAQHSMEPHEFKVLARSLKDVWEMLENPVDKNNIETYSEMKDIFQKSIVTAVDIAPGTILTHDHLSFKKPGDGISASNIDSILGMKTRIEMPKDHKISFGELR